MAENFYTMQEVMEKLRKTEQEVQDLVKQGKLRQYMDAGKPMYKKEDIDTLSEEVVGLDISSFGLAPDDSEPDLQLEETSEIQLEPGESGPQPPDDDTEPTEELKSEGGFGLSQMGDLSMADTNIGTVGINILSGTDDAFRLTEDTKAETQSADAAEIEEIENLDADSNLESFGSGSGLLDLSLQADDTSLGAVLDDILPAGAEEGAPDGGGELPVDQLGLAEESEDLLTEPAMASATAQPAAPLGAEPAPSAVPAAGMAFVPVAQVDPRTNLFGIAMFLPLTAIILAGIILTAAMRDIRPSLLNMMVERQIAGVGLFWYILGGLAVLAVLFSLFASVGGGSGAAKTKKEKTKKPKKEKRKKKKGK
ncbi:MAG: hypothetical protein ISS71_01530 [Phycisphaerae bacterium]|nr:hypothetical protein [Phycisphaerae bacterium]